MGVIGDRYKISLEVCFGTGYKEEKKDVLCLYVKMYR